MANVWDKPSLWPRRQIPETIENDWNRFYWDFPDIYDNFAVTTPPVIGAVREIVGLDGMTVADVGSGTGRSTFELARFARMVIGIEPWQPMRDFAVLKQRELGIQNAAFVEGLAQSLPLRDRSVDIVISTPGVPLALASEFGGVIGDQFVRDARRAVRAGVTSSTLAACRPQPEWATRRRTSSISARRASCSSKATASASGHGRAALQGPGARGGLVRLHLRPALHRLPPQDGADVLPHQGPDLLRAHRTALWLNVLTGDRGHAIAGRPNGPPATSSPTFTCT
jgi:SAM-dependent methyltransferase